jgi:hypothetical protein
VAFSTQERGVARLAGQMIANGAEGESAVSQDEIELRSGVA